MGKKFPVIMIIEDETLLLEAISTKFERLGMEVITCTTGQQAFDYLDNISQLPEVIWLDYYLKGDMDGLAVIKHCKSDPRLKSIPVLVVSNTASQDKIENMLALGAEKYFVKADHRLEELVEIVQELIEKESK